MQTTPQITPSEVAVISHQLKKEEDYWLKKLSGELVKSIFPYDYKRLNANETKTGRMKFEIPGQLFPMLMKRWLRPEVVYDFGDRAIGIGA